MIDNLNTILREKDLSGEFTENYKSWLDEEIRPQYEKHRLGFIKKF
jgi:hypothetical protein